MPEDVKSIVEEIEKDLAHADKITTMPVSENNEKIKYDDISNFKFGKEHLVRVIPTQFGKLVSLDLGMGKSVSVPSHWIHKKLNGEFSVGIAATKYFREYFIDDNEKSKFRKVIGANIIKQMEAFGYEESIFEPETPDEMWANLNN